MKSEREKREHIGDGEERDDVCRDFLKNVCSRGARCKFYHPPDVEKSQEKEEFNFCIDFQNRGCRREGCRYIHALRDDVERYKRSGEVTHALACAIAAVTHKDSINGIPYCKEFKLGKCTREHRCRYWHVDPDLERERRMRGEYGPPPGAHMGVPPAGAVGGYGGAAGGGPLPPGPGAGGPGIQPAAGPPQDWGRAGGGGGGGGRPGGGVRGGSSGGYGMPPGGGGMSPYAPANDGMARKRGRFDADDAYVMDIERTNAELRKENDSLKRELARERERLVSYSYEDLYALFRQHQSAQLSAVTAATVQQQQAQQQQQQHVVQQQQQQPNQAAPSNQPSSGPPAPPTGLPPPQSMGGSLGGISGSYHQSMAGVSNPNDVAVHWSTIQQMR